MGTENNSKDQRRERRINSDLHDYIRMIVPSIDEHRIVEYRHFCSIVKDVFSFASENETFITAMVFNFYNEAGNLDNNQLIEVCNQLKEVTREDDLMSIDYDNSAVFLLLPDAGWTGGVVNIGRRISESCKEKCADIKVDIYCAMMPFEPPKIMALNEDAKNKKSFLSVLRELFSR